ncbi:MAG: hypothetical protein KME19_04855 [Microcoleus vaginatus WJT46-NPBG5]|nr:hypothetical protein [Microcoleus vaginatus WJT46-NPBG5]
MRSYALTETRNQQGEVFYQAAVAPILRLKESRPSSKIISFNLYKRLMEGLTELKIWL